jgi:hypothetical protein
MLKIWFGKISNMFQIQILKQRLSEQQKLLSKQQKSLIKGIDEIFKKSHFLVSKQELIL